MPPRPPAPPADCITTFDDSGRLDLEAFRAVVEYVVALNLAGIVVAGEAGEGARLSAAERAALLAAAREQSAGRAPVVSAGEPGAGRGSAVAGVLPRECAEAARGDAGKAAYVAAVAECLERSADRVALLKAVLGAMGLPAGKPRGGGEPTEGELAEITRRLSTGGRLVAGGMPVTPGGGAKLDAARFAALIAPGLAEECLAAEPVRSELVGIFRPERGAQQYNHHAAVAAFGGRLFAAWSTGRINEDSPGQHVQFAHSADGRGWTAPHAAVPAEDGLRRWTCGGFWVRGEELWLLAVRYERARYVDGESAPGMCWDAVALEGLSWDGSGWRPGGVLLEDFYANEAPRRLPDGRWLMTGVNRRHDALVAVGGAGSVSEWRVVPVNARAGGVKLTEPSWFAARDGRLRLLLRDDGGSRRLWLSESRDGGEKWSPPVPSDLPDAQSKFFAMNLPGGRAAVVGNATPTPHRRRLLTLALSPDGRAFDRLLKLRFDPAAQARLPGMHKAAGFQYPNATLHAGRLWVIHSANKEDIDMLSVELAEM
jgi:hypothetical protein